MYDADILAYTEQIYLNEFLNVLKLMYDSYHRMVRQESIKVDDKETFLRNILVNKYLRINKEYFDIGY